MDEEEEKEEEEDEEDEEDEEGEIVGVCGVTIFLRLELMDNVDRHPARSFSICCKQARTRVRMRVAVI